MEKTMSMLLQDLRDGQYQGLSDYYKDRSFFYLSLF